MLFLPFCLLFLNVLGLPLVPDDTRDTDTIQENDADDGGAVVTVNLDDNDGNSNYIGEVTQLELEKNGRVLAIYEDFIFEDFYYEMEIEVGTPPQLMSVRLDTSSSDLYLNGNRYSYSQYFDLLSSESFEMLNSLAPFRLNVANQSLLTGRWVTDIVGSLGHTVKCQFAVIENGDVISTLGLGLENNEFLSNFLEASHKAKETYPNFCEELKDLGKIQRNGYSLWLDGLSYNSGLLYGAVDHSKYEGFLMKVPIHDLYAHAMGEGSKPKKLAIVLDFISAKSERDEYLLEIRKPVVLDSSSAISYLPERVIDDLGSFFNGQYIEAAEMYILDCDLHGELTFEFSGISFSIDIRDFVIPLSSPSSPNKCFLPMRKQEYSDHVLGNAFLKELYMVVDLESYEIALAKVVKMNSDQIQSDDIETMTTGIPRAMDALFYGDTSLLTLTYSTIFGY